MYQNEEELRTKVRRFAETQLKPIAMAVDEMDDISWESVRMMAKEGIFKYLVPGEYGGIGLRCVDLCIIREELARICIQADDTFAMGGLGTYPILRFGTEEQKRQYLPPVATGEKLASFSLTEPGHGSDIANMETAAVVEGDWFVLTGRKCFASNAGGAEVCPVFVRTGPGKGSRGLAVFVIDVKNAGPGLTCNGMKLMGPHPTYELIFDRYRVPKRNLLGELGMGFTIALSTLDMLRVTVGAAAIGMACGAYDEAMSYSLKRAAFGQPIIEFQAVQFKLADMATNIEAARALVLDVARRRDAQGAGGNIVKYASMAKLFATEAGYKVVDEALQIHGGWGLVKSARVQQLFRGIRATRIYEGTSEIQKLTIARMLKREAEGAK